MVPSRRCARSLIRVELPRELQDERSSSDPAPFASVAAAFVTACVARAVPRDTVVLLPPGRLGSRQQREGLRFLGYGWHVDVDEARRGWFFQDDGTVQHASAYLLADGKREAYARWLRDRPSRAFLTGSIWVVPREDTVPGSVDVAGVSRAMRRFLGRHAGGPNWD